MVHELGANRGFVPFAIYRLVLGTAVLVWALRT